MAKLTKKQFKQDIRIEKYTAYGHRRPAIVAIFYDWKTSQYGCTPKFNGYKYCIYARPENAKTPELINLLYDIVTGKRQDIEEYYIQLAVAPTDEQRFKVPLGGSDLHHLVRSYHEN